MDSNREWTADAWKIFQQIVEPDDPLDPATSMLARVQARFLRTKCWIPIWKVLDTVLENAAEQAALSFDERKGSLERWFRWIAHQRAKDALDAEFMDCPKCMGSNPQQRPNAGEKCPRCQGRGRVLREPTYRSADLDLQSRPRSLAPRCPTCQGAMEVDGQDCPQCRGMGVIPWESDEWESAPQPPHQQGEPEGEWFAEVEPTLRKQMDRLPSPPDPAFVRDFASTVRAFSPADKLQVSLDYQLFNTDKSRTTSDDLQQLSQQLGKSKDAIRQARVRIRERLKAVFIRHGVPTPEALR